MMLGIAYSASLGGISTIIGTPPNAALAGAIKEMYGIELSFATWMLFGVPIAWIFIMLVWIYLIKIAYPLKVKSLPGGKEIIDRKSTRLNSSHVSISYAVFCLKKKKHSITRVLI